MLDIKLFRENPEIIKVSQKKRGLAVEDIDEIIKLDKCWREILQKVEELKKERNNVSEKINQLKKSGKPTEDEIKRMQHVADEIANLDKQEKELKEKRDKLLLEIPNIIADDVPIGKDENDNKEIKKVRKPKKILKAKHHQDILEALDCLDVKQASKIAGARFYYLKGDLVKLNQALINFAFDFLVKKGFQPIQPPYMLNKLAMSGVVHFSAFEDAIYKIQDEDLYLIGTAENSIVAYEKDKMLDSKKLPMRFVGISPCFRKEAGTHGKDTKGIFRVHQFEKVEQVSFCKREQAKKEFDLLLANLEAIFKALEIPYRLVVLCSGDTGKKDSKTIDLEGWFPAQNKYRELGSCSNLGDYQARGSNIRYLENGKPVFATTLNSTTIATERAIACLVENFQQKNSSVKIPKALWKYTGFKVIKAKK